MINSEIAPFKYWPPVEAPIYKEELKADVEVDTPELRDNELIDPEIPPLKNETPKILSPVFNAPKLFKDESDGFFTDKFPPETKTPIPLISETIDITSFDEYSIAPKMEKGSFKTIPLPVAYKEACQLNKSFGRAPYWFVRYVGRRESITVN